MSMRLKCTALVLLFGALCLFGDICIVQGETPTEFERLAARELLDFLARLTAEKCSIVSSPSSEQDKAIFLGDTPEARMLDGGRHEYGKEEWSIRGDGKRLVIAGGCPIGVLYGVYAFLERLGVRFLAWDTVKLPNRRDTLDLPVIDERRSPDFAGRHIFDMYPIFFDRIQAQEPLQKWKMHRLRNRFNGSHTGQKAHRDLYEGDLFHLSPALPPYHNFYNYLPPEKYFASHPEYFSMDKEGRRFHGTPQGGNICLSNPDVAKIVTETLLDFIRSDREKTPDNPPLMYDISQMDSSAFMCLCPSCREISDVEGESGLLLSFMNKVAGRIKTEYPEICLRTFAYSSTLVPPKSIRPLENVYVQYCDPYMKSDCFRPLGHEFNKEQAEMLESWRRTGANLVLWDYWNMGFDSFFDPPRPEVVLDALQSDFIRFHSAGVKAIFIEAERSFVSPQNFIDLEYYLASRLMVDRNADVEKAVEEFLEGYYGAANVEMAAFLALLRKGTAAEPRRQVMMQVGNWSYLTPQTLLDIHRMLLAAQEKVLPGTNEFHHVRCERIAPLWYTLYLRGRTMPLFKTAGFTEEALFDELHTLVIEQLERFKGTKIKAQLDKFEQRFTALKASLPMPEQFAATEGAKVFGWPQRVEEGLSMVIDAPDSAIGKAIVSKNMADAKWHGKDTVRKLPVTSFGFWAPGVCSKSIHVKDIPSDGAFHWYCIPNVKLGPKSIFWGHLWRIKVNLASAYRLEDDGVSRNDYDLHFSARFIGPAYIPNDTRPNEIAVGRLVLTPCARK